MSGKDIGHINVNVSSGAVYAAAMQRVIEFKAVLRRISGDPHAFKVTSLTRPSAKLRFSLTQLEAALVLLKVS